MPPERGRRAGAEWRLRGKVVDAGVHAAGAQTKGGRKTAEADAGPNEEKGTEAKDRDGRGAGAALLREYARS